MVSSPISGSNWILIFLLCYLRHPNFQHFLASNSETLLVYHPPNNSLLLWRIRLLVIRVCLWTKPLKQVTTLSNVKEKPAKHFKGVPFSFNFSTCVIRSFLATLATLVHQCLILASPPVFWTKRLIWIAWRFTDSQKFRKGVPHQWLMK